MAQCDLFSVGMNSTTGCTENFSGITSVIYIGIPTEANVQYKVDASTSGDVDNFFTPESFDKLEVIGVRIKAQSGKVDSTNNQNGGGFNSVLTCLVADDMDKMSTLARVLNNRHDWAAFTSDGNGNMYVCYAPGFDMKFELSGTTGDTTDSDHGDTLTITASPMKFPRAKWNGHVDAASSEGKYQLVKGAVSA